MSVFSDYNCISPLSRIPNNILYTWNTCYIKMNFKRIITNTDLLINYIILRNLLGTTRNYNKYTPNDITIDLY